MAYTVFSECFLYLDEDDDVGNNSVDVWWVRYNVDVYNIFDFDDDDDDDDIDDADENKMLMV